VLSWRRSAASSRAKSKKLRVVSGRKQAHLSNKSLELKETSISMLTTSEESIGGGCGHRDKDKENCAQNEVREIREKIRKNLELFQSRDTPRQGQVGGQGWQGEGHQFPKKALCGHRKKIQERHKEPLQCPKLQCTEFESKEAKKEECLTRSNNSLRVFEPSLNNSQQLISILSCHADQEQPGREPYDQILSMVKAVSEEQGMLTRASGQGVKALMGKLSG
jgi:hypothetical protein